MLKHRMVKQTNTKASKPKMMELQQVMVIVKTIERNALLTAGQRINIIIIIYIDKDHKLVCLVATNDSVMKLMS
jgi:hypothetical protein